MRWLPVLMLLAAGAGCKEDVCTCEDVPEDCAAPAEEGDAGDVVLADDGGPDEGGPPEAGGEGDGDDRVEGTGAEDADVPGEAEADVSPPAPFSFVVFADNQFATENCTSGVPERLAIPEAIVALAPTFVLEAGDLMDHGYDDGAYAHFVDCYAGMMAAVPFFPTMGNHDAGSGGIWNYKAFLEEQLATRNPAAYGAAYAADFGVWYEDDPNTYSTDFDAPGPRDDVPSGVSFKTYYAFRHRNAYFISFEVGTRWWSNTPRSWLRTHLTAARSDPGIDHVFAFLHHPIYSTTMWDDSDSECTRPVREAYEPLFREFDVTMVFSGHAHVYDRFWVPDDGHATAGSPPSTYDRDADAVHYVVTGGGGGPLPGCSPMPSADGVAGWDYSQARGCGYHVTRVQVEGPRIVVSIVGVSGGSGDYATSVWDTFTIE